MTKIFFILFVCMGSLALAQTSGQLSPEQQQALQETQDLLKTQQKRDTYIKNNKQATSADDFVKQLTGGNAGNNQEIYELASEVFQVFAARTNGDPQKMQDEITKFAKDPAGFANTWPPEQRAKLKALADKLSAGKLKPH